MGGMTAGAGLLVGGAGMLVGGVSAVGGAFNPMQLLNSKKKKQKDTRQYRSRNDIEFSDGSSQDHASDNEEENEEKKLAKTSIAYL